MHRIVSRPGAYPVEAVTVNMPAINMHAPGADSAALSQVET